MWDRIVGRLQGRTGRAICAGLECLLGEAESPLFRVGAPIVGECRMSRAGPLVVRVCTEGDVWRQVSVANSRRTSLASREAAGERAAYGGL